MRCPEGQERERAGHDRRNRADRSRLRSDGRRPQRDRARQHELHGENRSEFVDGRIFRFAGQRGASPPSAKNVPTVTMVVPNATIPSAVGVSRCASTNVPMNATTWAAA
jgi:hypothetical protein